MRVLALDASSRVGWALFADVADRAPKLGTWNAPRGHLVGDYGRVFVELESWLAGLLAASAPDVVAYEAPLVPFGKFVERQSSRDIIRVLIGMASVIDLVATRAGLRCIEVAVPTAKKKLTGSGWAKKADMIAGAHRLGIIVENDHQADAIAVALCAYDHCGLGIR